MIIKQLLMAAVWRRIPMFDVFVIALAQICVQMIFQIPPVTS